MQRLLALAFFDFIVLVNLLLTEFSASEEGARVFLVKMLVVLSIYLAKFDDLVENIGIWAHLVLVLNYHVSQSFVELRIQLCR